MEAANRDIIVDIMRIRRNKVVQVVVICLVGGAAFVFCVSQLAATVFPRSRQTAPPPQSSRPDLHDAEMDNVEPEVVVDDVDTELDRGKLLQHGVDITLSKYSGYNTSAERVAKRVRIFDHVPGDQARQILSESMTTGTLRRTM
jgi:hypothetical protein